VAVVIVDTTQYACLRLIETLEWPGVIDILHHQRIAVDGKRILGVDNSRDAKDQSFCAGNDADSPVPYSLPSTPRR
jgi:hypothetical protein